MKYRHPILIVAAGAGLFAQSSRQSSTGSVDFNGRRADIPAHAITEAPTGSTRAETTRSLNGRTVPLESAEDRVISDTPSGRTVERIMRRYDQTGVLSMTDRVRIEERKNPDGTSTVQVTTYRSDVNGQSQLVERATTQVRKGDTTETTTTVERPGLSGSLELAEKAVAVEKPLGGESTQVDATVYRRDVSGTFQPAIRDIKTTTKSGDQTTVDATRYETGSTGRMEVAERSIGKTVTNPDGSQVEKVDVYSRFSAGRSADINTDGQPRLQEQIVRQRTPGPGNTIVETTSVKARLPNDPTRFGDFEKTSRTTYVTTDAAGREVRSTDIAVGRRDPNGRLVVQEQGRENSVAPKPPVPEAKPADGAAAKPAEDAAKPSEGAKPAPAAKP